MFNKELEHGRARCAMARGFERQRLSLRERQTTGAASEGAGAHIPMFG
jgi:hypothetical protein